MSLKEVEKLISNSLSILDNVYVKNVVKMLLVLYAGLAAPRLPSWLANLFNNSVFRLLILFLIAYIGLKDTSIALMSAVAFTLTIIFLKKAETTDSIFGALQSAVDTPQEWINDLVDDTQSTINTAVDTVQDAVGLDNNTIGNLVNNAQSGINSLVDNVQSGINTVVDQVQTVLPNGRPEPKAEAPEAPVVVGYSAGGFGAEF